MSQPWLSQGRVEWLPTIPSLCELQAGGGGARIHSATENVTSESVPHSGTAGDGGQREVFVGGGDVHLRLVVRGHQDTCKSFL